jgi:hypothetical protein
MGWRGHDRTEEADTVVGRRRRRRSTNDEALDDPSACDRGGFEAVERRW